MSEVLCECFNASKNTTAYCVIEKNVSYEQFVNYLATSLSTKNFKIISEDNTAIVNDEQLKALYNAKNFRITIVPLEEYEKQVSEKESIEEVAETEFVIGETIQNILHRFGVTVNENENPREVIKRLPNPMRRLVNQKVAMMQRNPKKIVWVVNYLANVFAVSQKNLLSEVKACLVHLQETEPKEQVKREPLRCEKAECKIESCKPEQQEIKVSNTPVVHRAICDRCDSGISGIRYKCLHCRDYDLCEECEALNAKENFHDSNHVFAKIRTLEQAVLIRKVCGGSFMKRSCKGHFNGRKFPRIAALEASVVKLQQQVEELRNKSA